MKPRSIKGIGITLSIMMFCAIPNSTRAYIPYVQPLVKKRLLPRVKKTKFVVIKKVKGYGTGYFGPKRGDYETEEEYLEAVAMNGAGKKTSSGTKPRAKRTIAADTRFYPLGTIIFIPEKNIMGKVEDEGSAVKGKKHIDIFCGYGRKAKRLADNLGEGKPITLVVMKEVEV